MYRLTSGFSTASWINLLHWSAATCSGSKQKMRATRQVPSELAWAVIMGPGWHWNWNLCPRAPSCRAHLQSHPYTRHRPKTCVLASFAVSNISLESAGKVTREHHLFMTKDKTRQIVPGMLHPIRVTFKQFTRTYVEWVYSWRFNPRSLQLTCNPWGTDWSWTKPKDSKSQKSKAVCDVDANGANPASIHSSRVPRGDNTWGAYLNPKGLQFLRTKLHVKGGGWAVVVHAEHHEHLAIEGFCKSPKESRAQVWHGFFSQQLRSIWQREGRGMQTRLKWAIQNPLLDISKNITMSFASSLMCPLRRQPTKRDETPNKFQEWEVRDNMMLWSSAG